MHTPTSSQGDSELTPTLYSVAPGIFPSEMTSEGSNDENKSHIDSEGYREKKLIPAGRPGKEEDMAQAILMLAVNNYINGQTVVVDGGYLLGMIKSVASCSISQLLICAPQGHP